MSTTFVGVGCSFPFSLAGVVDGVAAGWAEEKWGLCWGQLKAEKD